MRPSDSSDIGRDGPEFIRGLRRPEDHLCEDRTVEAVVLQLCIVEHLLDCQERGQVMDVTEVTGLVAGKGGQHLVGAEFTD